MRLAEKALVTMENNYVIKVIEPIEFYLLSTNGRRIKRIWRVVKNGRVNK